MNPARKFVQKYKSLSKPARASMWFIGCYIIQRGIQFIGMPIYTRIMPETEYGLYTVFLSWFNLLNVFSSLSIYNGTFNKAMVKYERDRDSYISSVQYLTLTTGIIFCVGILICHTWIYRYLGFDIRFQLLLCMYLLLFPSLQYWSQKQRFLFAYKKLVWVTLINSAASLFFGIVFVVFAKNKSYALVLATVLVQMVINVWIFISLARQGKCFYRKDFWEWSIIMALPLLPHYLSEILLGHADRLMINQMCGADKAGIYNIVYQISMIMTILRTGINGAFTPWLYYSLKERRYTDIRRVTKYITIFMWSLTLVFMLLGPEILKLAAPTSYYEAVTDIPAIMTGCFFIFVYVLFINVEVYFEKNSFVAIASILASILNVGLNYICIPRYGYLAAGYTTMVSYAVFMRLIVKKERDIKSIFDGKIIAAASVSIVLLALVLLKIYEFMLLRWISIAVVAGVILKQRRNIQNLLNKMKNEKE